MKTIILTIVLILFAACGIVYGNPAIDALENEIAKLQKDIQIENFERFVKLNEILDSMRRQERDNEIIHQWEKGQVEEPCTSMFRKDCVNGVRI